MLGVTRTFRPLCSVGWRAAATSARCHYEVLGVHRTATEEEIRGAFRQRAKQTHPDIAKGTGGKPNEFSGLVEAYRILRDSRRRAEYDRERAYQQRPGDRGSSGSQWPQGEAHNMSEEFRANLYGYAYQGRSASEADAQSVPPTGLRSESAAIGFLFLSAIAFLVTRKFDSHSHEDMRDPHPSRLPGSRLAGGASAGVASRLLPEAPVAAGASEPPPALASRAAAAAAAQEELVRAYWNPFAEKWIRIPEGYEAPGAMDLTAWHKKRADPVEWSRLFAEGKLSEILPRGGLRERYIPAWNTHEPILLMDPHTGKTVQATGKLPPRLSKPTCDVQF